MRWFNRDRDPSRSSKRVHLYSLFWNEERILPYPAYCQHKI